MNHDNPVIDKPETVAPGQVIPALQAIMDASKEPKQPDNYSVLLHNDDVTPYQTVVDTLVEVFGHDSETARRLMFVVHRTGQPGVVCVLPEPDADSKIAEAAAKSVGYPLTFTKEKA